MALLLAGPAGSGRTTAATAAAAALGLHLVPFNCHDLTSAAGGMAWPGQAYSCAQLQASLLLSRATALAATDQSLLLTNACGHQAKPLQRCCDARTHCSWNAATTVGSSVCAWPVEWIVNHPMCLATQVSHCQKGRSRGQDPKMQESSLAAMTHAHTALHPSGPWPPPWGAWTHEARMQAPLEGVTRNDTWSTWFFDILEEDPCSAGSQAHGRALVLALQTAAEAAADFSPALLLLRNFEALAGSALGDPAHPGRMANKHSALWIDAHEDLVCAAGVSRSPLKLALSQ